MTAPVSKTKWHSWHTGRLCKGCSLCVQGRKLVLFITGLCGQKCFYCPISELKFGKDVIFANEWKVENPDGPKEMLEEVRLTEAKGAGITGGDPLMRLERCCSYIKLLKKTFGKEFHIHLYTPLKLVTKEKLAKLHEAGLDEIRFHPDLDDSALWENIKLAKAFKCDVGVEIPVVPGYEDKTRKLIDFIMGIVDFLNLNELELSDSQTPHYKLGQMGFEPKDEISYGVLGSQKIAIDFLVYASQKGLAAHYCTAKLKDSVQVKERLKLRAKNVALPFEEATSEGTIKRGCAYLKELAPGENYSEKLKKANKKEILPKLEEIKNKLGIGKKDIAVDPYKLRLLINPKLIKRYSNSLKSKGLLPAFVEELPTHDGLEIEVEFV